MKMRKDPTLAWHKRYRHISIKSIKKLEAATEGAVITLTKIYNRNKD